MPPHDGWPPSLVEVTASIVALIAIGSIAWAALVEGSPAAETALVGASGAVTGWLFRGAAKVPPNGSGAAP